MFSDESKWNYSTKNAWMSTKKIPCLVLVFFFFTADFAFAQSSFSVGLKAGISIPNLQSSGGNPLSEGWSSRQGPYAGFVGEMNIGKNLYLQTELNFSSQGGKKNGLQAIPVSPEYAAFFPAGIPVPDFVYSNYNSEAKLNYLELPVLLKFDYPLSESISLFVNAGLYMGYLVAAKNVTSGANNIYLDKAMTIPLLPGPVSFDTTIDIKSDLEKFNFGIQAGVGVAYHFKSGSKLFLAGGGNYGLTHIQKDPANGENNTGAATVTLGYLFKL